MSNIKERFQTEAETEISLTSSLPTRGRTIMISYKDLVPNRKNRQLNYDKVYALADSIQTNGRVIDPLQVTAIGDGKYLLWVGHHRRAALQYLVEVLKQKDYEYVKCEVMQSDPENNELVMLDSNLERAELTPFDTMMAIGRKEEILAEKKTKGTLRDIISQQNTNYKPTQVGTYLRIYKKASPSVKNALKDGQITLSIAAKLSLYDTHYQNSELSNILNNKKQKNKQPSKFLDLKDHIQSKLQTKITFKDHSLQIHFNDISDLNRVLEILNLGDVVNE